MSTFLTNLHLSSNGLTTKTADFSCGFVGLTDMYSLIDYVGNVCFGCVPLDVFRIKANKTIRRCAVILTEMTDNCSAWTRSMICKTRFSADASCITVRNIVSYGTILGVVGVSNRDTVTYFLDNPVEVWSVLGSHVINILRNMMM